MPHFFVGKSFIETAKIIYFSSVEFLDFLLIKPESGELPRNELKSLKQFALQLIAIQVKSEDIFSNSSKILINPVNHIICKDEIGYVIALDQSNTEAISNFSKESPLYRRYIRNINLIAKENENSSVKKGFKINDFTNKILQNMDESSCNWKIYEEKWKNVNKNIRNQPKSFNMFDEKPSTNESIPTIFNLHLGNSPKGLFKNHLIIKGHLNEMSSIAYIIRFYSERPILLFTHHKINQGIWAKIRANYTNVFCVLGDAMKVKHIEQLDPKKAFKILILTSSKDEFLQDSTNVIFTRILADFFETTNFLVELHDENNIRFISTKPQITINNQLDYFYWPYFFSGSVHFSSLIMSILARALYNKYWVDFLKNLAQPKHDDFRASQENNLENSNIMTFEITKEIAKELQIYGKLQYFLMNQNPPAMAIALLKEKSYINSKNRKKMSAFAADSGNRLKAMLANFLLKTLDDLYQYSYLMTNPSFMTRIEAGDKVLFLGTLQNKIDKKTSFIKEGKFIAKIEVYLNKNSIDGENLKKEEEKKRVMKFFKERKKIWKANERRVEYKEKLTSMLTETNKMIRFTLENYKNVFEDGQEDDDDDDDDEEV